MELLTRIQSREYDESRAVLTTYLYPHLKGRMTRWLEQNIGCMALSKNCLLYTSDEETFELAQKRIATRQRPTKVDEIDLFSGLLFCGDCGYKMYAVRGLSLIHI